MLNISINLLCVCATETGLCHISHFCMKVLAWLKGENKNIYFTTFDGLIFYVQLSATNK